MTVAARWVLETEAENGFKAYQSVRDLVDRWSHFVDFAKSCGVGRMERVDRELVVEYGKVLADRVDTSEIGAAYAQNLLSSVNSVMRSATKDQWQRVAPVKDCHIPQRTTIRQQSPGGLDRAVYSRAIAELQNRGIERAVSVAQLARELGLRSKEASLIDAKKAFSEARATGLVTVTIGTKGGRLRLVPVVHDRQLAALERAARIQGQGRSLMPADQSWAKWREGGLRNTPRTRGEDSSIS
jgi:hypothetical protein